MDGSKPQQTVHASFEKKNEKEKRKKDMHMSETGRCQKRIAEQWNDK